MKSIEELMEIKNRLHDKVAPCHNSDDIRVVVGMATCGMAAGATPVLKALEEGVEKNGLADKVSVVQTGCIGICQFEPIVEVYQKGKEKVTYVKMTVEKANEVIERHLKGGEVITDYTIGKVLK